MHKYLLGIDIGGTSVKIGLFTITGELLEKWQIRTSLQDNGDALLPSVWDSVVSKLQEKNRHPEDLLGIGVGIPGYVNPLEGIVHEAINIGWESRQVVKEMEKLSNQPVWIENDANLAVLGENWKGAGRNREHVIAVTLGTGVGSGIISNGNIINGINGMGGELGHILLEEDGALCNCGNRGCLETIASATGIVRQAMELIRKSPSSALAAYYRKHQKITSRDIFILAENGDTEALSIVERAANALGFTFANLGVTLNPETILIGGGVAQAGDFLLDKINASFKHFALPRVSQRCTLKLAELGNDAGIIGTAFLVQQHTKKTLP